MEIHKPKWHSGNIKIWHILYFFYSHHPPILPPLLSHRLPSPSPPSLLQGFSTESTSAVEILLEGHINPPWHSWLSRQTDGLADRLTPLWDDPAGTKIYNQLNLIPGRVKSVWTVQQIQGKLTSLISQASSSCIKFTSYWTFISNPLKYTVIQ